MPHCWRARFEVPRGFTVTAPSSTAIVTSSVAVNARVPFGPFTSTVCPETVAVTPPGRSTGFLPMRDIAPPQNTVQRTSPPTLAVRACASDMTPFGVETMATPRPWRTCGISLTPE